MSMHSMAIFGLGFDSILMMDRIELKGCDRNVLIEYVVEGEVPYHVVGGGNLGNISVVVL